MIMRSIFFIGLLFVTGALLSPVPPEQPKIPDPQITLEWLTFGPAVRVDHVKRVEAALVHDVEGESVPSVIEKIEGQAVGGKWLHQFMYRPGFAPGADKKLRITVRATGRNEKSIVKNYNFEL